MNKFLKFSVASLLCSTMLFANSSKDDFVINFEKNRVAANPDIEVLNVSLNTKKQIPVQGWTGYLLDVKIKVKKENRVVTVKDILFSDGKYISMDFVNPKNGKSLKSLVTPNLTAKYYDKSKLIAGNHNAKDKIVIFSDPLCPFCMDLVPDVINHVKKNEKNIALYYYHFPLLRIHPAAGPLSRIMDVAKHKGMKDIELKVYEADWDEYFTSRELDEKKILEAFNKEFKTNITLEEIRDSKVQKLIQTDMKLGDDVMVNGTPTVFVNGQKDETRRKYETLGK